MQLTLHEIRRIPYGAFNAWLQATPAWLVKTRHAPSRHRTHARVYKVIQLRPCMAYEYTPLSLCPFNPPSRTAPTSSTPQAPQERATPTTPSPLTLTSESLTPASLAILRHRAWDVGSRINSLGVRFSSGVMTVISPSALFTPSCQHTKTKQKSGVHNFRKNGMSDGVRNVLTAGIGLLSNENKRKKKYPSVLNAVSVKKKWYTRYLVLSNA